MSDRLKKKAKKVIEKEISEDNGELNLEIPGLIIINGRQGSGKSFLIKYIMYQLKDKFKHGIVFTNTAFDNNPFPYINKKYIHEKYSDEALDNLMEMQKKIVEKGKNCPAFVIFDDCLNSENQFTSDSLENLSMQLRHYNITVIMSTQYTNMIPVPIRSNAMEVFIFTTRGTRALESLHESYGQNFDRYSEFKDYLFKVFREEYNFVHYNTMSDEYQVLKCPSEIPDFEIKF